MNHRDFASIPIIGGALTPNYWLPYIQSFSELGAVVMWSAGVVLLCLQIVYYWKMIRKK